MRAQIQTYLKFLKLFESFHRDNKNDNTLRTGMRKFKILKCSATMHFGLEGDYKFRKAFAR